MVAECIIIKEKLSNVQSELSSKDAKLLEAMSNLDSCSKDMAMVKDLKKENEKLSEDYKDSKSKLERLTGAEKRHDLLDLELEEAETRVKQLTSSNVELKEEVNRLREDISREVILSFWNINRIQTYVYLLAETFSKKFHVRE